MSPPSWLKPESVTVAFAEDLRGWLTPQVIRDLPLHPEFVFAATDLRTGLPLYFERLPAYPGDWKAMLRHGDVVDPDLPVAYAVAASAAFPGVLPPMTVRSLEGRDDEVMQFVDGGLFDNVGLGALEGKASLAFISDGGGSSDRDWRPAGKFKRLKGAMRIMQIPDAQIREFQRDEARRLSEQGSLGIIPWSIERHRWLPPDERAAAEAADQAAAVQILIDEHLTGTSNRTRYLPDTAKMIAGIRTDADAFSGWEVAFLLNNGYLECADALATNRDHLPAGISPDLPLDPPSVLATVGIGEGSSQGVLRDSRGQSFLGRPYSRGSLTSALRRKAPPMAGIFDRIKARVRPSERTELAPHDVDQMLGLDDLVLKQLFVTNESEGEEFKREAGPRFKRAMRS